MAFVAMARRYSGCDVVHQNPVAMKWPAGRFDGVFADASLFHVPGRKVPGVLADIAETVKAGGGRCC